MATATEGISRAQTPPPHRTLQSRGIVTAGFTSFKTKELKTNSHSVTWNCDGRRLVSCGYEKGVRVWQPGENMDERHSSSLVAAEITGNINCAATDPIHHDLICGASRADRKLVFWDFRQKAATRQVSTTEAIVSVQYSADGNFILAEERGDIEKSLPDTIAIYDVKTGELQSRAGGSSIGLSNTMYQATFNHTSQLVYATSSAGSVCILDYPSLKYLDKITGHDVKGGCLTIAVDPRGRYVATGGADALVNVWDVGEWICLRTIASAESSVVTSAFSYDGEWIASACESNYLDITETETAQHNHRLHTRSVATSLAWHPSQHVLAFAGGERKGDGWISLLNAP